MHFCHGLPILFTLFLRMMTASALHCYVCNSQDDVDCASKPKVISLCPPTCTGCTKIVATDYRYDYRFDDNIQNNKIIWDGENLNWKVIAKPMLVVVRKCYSTYNNFNKRLGCYRLFDTKRRATVCVCERNLCNDAITFKLNIETIILSILLLLFCMLQI